MRGVPKVGQHVKWETPQGETRGTAEKIVRRTATVKGHVAKATAANPEVVVKSSKSGKTAIHKPSALKTV